MMYSEGSVVAISIKSEATGDVAFMVPGSLLPRESLERGHMLPDHVTNCHVHSLATVVSVNCAVINHDW